MKIILLVLFTSITIVASRQCSSSADCGPDECCVDGMARYSTPRCARLGNEGESCPMGNSQSAPSIYRLMCPCAQPMSCKRATCSYS